MSADMKKIEIYFLFDDYTWSTEIIEVPAEVADSESEDCYKNWLVSPAGKAFRDTWACNTVGTGVHWWGADTDNPRVAEADT
jgi:hypothetical protein